MVARRHAHSRELGVSPLWPEFGCVGDGATNDAAGLALWTTYCNANDLPGDGGGLVYKTNTCVELPRLLPRLRLDVSGVTASSTVITGLGVVAGAKITGSDIWAGGYATATITATLSRFATQISVTTTGFAAGDTILIYENAAWNAAGASVCCKSEVRIIKTIDSASLLTICGRIEGNYTSGVATIRKYGGQIAKLGDVRIVGGGAALAQYGLVIGNMTQVEFETVDVRKCEKVGFGVYNCAEVSGDLVRVFNANLTGFGYGFQYSGSSNVTVDRVLAFQCRHATTSGGGASGKQLSRDISFGSVRGRAMLDAVVDEHPGVVDSQYGLVSGFGDPEFSTVDGVMIQGSSCQIGQIDTRGFKGRGACVQHYGHGDGIGASYDFGKLKTRGGLATSTFAFLVEDDATSAAAGTWPIASIKVDLDAISNSGSRISCGYQAVENITVTGSSETLDSANNGLLISLARGSAGRVFVDGKWETPTGGAGEALHVVGASGYEFDIDCGRSLIQGGTTGLAVTYANADTRLCRIEGFSTNRVVLGTSGTLLESPSLTIASGVIAPRDTASLVTVDTQSAAATDDLDTITGTRTAQTITLRAASSARSVVVKDGTGNLRLNADCTLDDDVDTITLQYTGSVWLELARSNNA